MVHKDDWPAMQEWLTNNEIDYIRIYSLVTYNGFAITAESEEQKQHLVWFKLKWMNT